MVHLATVVGSYLALFGLAALAASWFSDVPWVILALPVPYLALLALNVPLRVLLACVLFMAAFFALFFALPPLPVWLCLALIPACHFIQNLAHKVWTREDDMARFKAKYQKGPALFLLLSLYELPILLNYLVFNRRHWS